LPWSTNSPIIPSSPDNHEEHMPRWHFGSPAIPVTALLISALALSVPVFATAAGPGEPLRFEALLWLTALIPAFLLAFYRGWQGVATGLALGMAAFSLAQVYLIGVGGRLPDWPFMLSITLAYIGIALALGAVAERLHGEREKAEQLALLDPLTDLPNRRYLDLILGREFAAARRGRLVVAVAFDVDGLKEINDRHGHLAGDEALQAVGRVLARNTRAMDLSARLGGDEFVSILSASTAEGALVFVRRVLEEAERIEGLPQTIQLSAGVAPYHMDMVEPRDLLYAADQALYRAKARRASSIALATAPDRIEAVAPGAPDRVATGTG
jgi:diguanylate cyclase (GGDEF)-like protein